MRLLFLWLLFPILSYSQDYAAGPSYSAKQYMLQKVNDLRASGCKCGSRYMPPVDPVSWNAVLFESAFDHARDMSRRNYFSHVARNGKDIGDRAADFGYTWEVIGENIGDGQRHFDEVFLDWKKSPDHCRMMMHPEVIHMAVARYKYKWVQHFGKPRSRYSYSRD